MAIFRGFKPQAMQKIAGRLGYKGSMEEFDNFLEQNPEKKRQMIVFEEAAKQMARGGVVKAQQGQFIGPIEAGPPAGFFENQEISRKIMQGKPVGGSPQQDQFFDNLTKNINQFNTQEKEAQKQFNPLTQSYVPTLGEAPGQIPAYGQTGGEPQGLGQVSATLAQTGAIPVGAVTQPQLTLQQPQQFIDPREGQLGQPNQAQTFQATTTQTLTPEKAQADALQVEKVSPAVNTAISANQAAQGDISNKAQVVAAQETATSVGNLSAAQGNAILIENPVQRQVREGEIVNEVANAETAKKFTEQVQAATATPSDKATVAGQLASLTANFDATNPPSWAAGAIRGVQAVMQQRGLGASSIAGQALIQAAMESALPIAQADASVQAQFETQNLSNRQQRAMLAAQQRAQFIGIEFDQAFQARVQNAAKISDIANQNFTSEQQVLLENSRLSNTVNLNNLSNRQALVVAQASALANLDTANLTNRQQAAVQNAQSFLQMDMTNLTNRQQMDVFNAQQRIQSLFTDQAAENAARQFNATSQNQVEQFFANLATTVGQANASQANAQAQFNAGELNTLQRFNSEIANQRDQFNATNQLAIAQNNAVWRRELATADTAIVNRANELNAKAVLDVSNEQYNNLWQFYADTMEWAWKSSESEFDRIRDMTVANISADAQKEAAERAASGQRGAAVGSLVGKLGAAAISAAFGGA